MNDGIGTYLFNNDGRKAFEAEGHHIHYCSPWSRRTDGTRIADTHRAHLYMCYDKVRNSHNLVEECTANVSTHKDNPIQMGDAIVEGAVASNYNLVVTEIIETWPTIFRGPEYTTYKVRVKTI